MVSARITVMLRVVEALAGRSRAASARLLGRTTNQHADGPVSCAARRSLVLELEVVHAVEFVVLVLLLVLVEVVLVVVFVLVVAEF